MNLGRNSMSKKNHRNQQASTNSGNSKKLLLAYSGGLDTSVICKWLSEQGYEVTAYVANVGQEEEFDLLEEKARASGASDFLLDDLREVFVDEYIMPAIFFHAYYEGRYLLGTSLARPVIAKGMVEAAKARGISILSHGATGKGNDQLRFELGFYALMPGVKVVAPWRDPAFFTVIKGRREAMAYAKEKGIPVKASKKQPWSSDANLMHISFEAGILENPRIRPPKEMFEYTKSPLEAPDLPLCLSLGFTQGLPSSLNGKEGSAMQILIELNKLGGAHGIGRADLVESRAIGMKSRGVYETPGVTILQAAHRDIECLNLEASLIALKDKLAIDFAGLVYAGDWFCDTIEALLAFAKKSQENVNGELRLELYKGNITIIERHASNSLYDENLASMEDDSGAYDAELAEGYIRLRSLEAQLRAKRFNSNSKNKNE